MVIRICLVLCLCLGIQKDTVIPWRNTSKLSWSDFKAKPRNTTNAAAVTASGLSFSFSIKQSNIRVISFTTQVYAYFYPNESWYKPEQANDHVLKHEQLHFDITELYARKFRQRISKLKISNTIRKTLKALQEIINKELDQMQQQYDRETSHSRNAEAQKKWEKYIASELNKLSKYASR